MKKMIIGIGAVLLTASAVTYASTTTKTTNKSETCKEASNCVCCPCTPDCQPGDDWCICPTNCEK